MDTMNRPVVSRSCLKGVSLATQVLVAECRGAMLCCPTETGHNPEDPEDFSGTRRAARDAKRQEETVRWDTGRGPDVRQE